MTKDGNINPSILVWARETAGLGLEEAADRLGLAPSSTATTAERLAQFEAGERSPTRSQLARISALYRRPLITFYMRSPPERGDRGQDFRRASSGVSKRENALLDALLRDVRARQEMVKALLEDEEDFTKLAFVGSASTEDGIQPVVAAISRTLSFDNTSKVTRRGDANDLFKLLRERTEKAGVFVLLMGDLGSHHSALSADVFRGFAIADSIAPFIVINDQDAKVARSFTLIHELVHIWLGQSGVSGVPNADAPQTSRERVERFCNDVASEFLLPTKALGSRPDILDRTDKRVAHDVISGIAEAWSVSEPMVAYRLNRIGWISQPIYEALLGDYSARWRAAKLKAKDNAKERDGGPSYYVVKQSKLGSALIEVVRRTLRDNLLSHTKAAKVLGVKPSSVEPLLRGYEQDHGTPLRSARMT